MENTTQRTQQGEEKAPLSRGEILAALQRYEDFLEQEMAVYRRQRAWKVMLWLRKFYDLILRQFTKAPVKTIRRIFDGSLEAHEVTLPSVWDFVPVEILHGYLPSQGNAPACCDVILLPIFDFECRFQRPQQIAIWLALLGHRVYWVSPSRTLDRTDPAAYKLRPLRRNLYEVQLRAEPFEFYEGAMTEQIAGELSVSLLELIRHEGVSECAALLQFPFWRKLALRLREATGAKVIYDCMDDWQNWPIDPVPSEANRADERALFGEADAVVTTSRLLLERAQSFNAKAHMIRNAADFEFFHHAEDGLGSSAYPSPVIGYYGAIEEWFNIEAVAHAARSRPSYTFVLTGRMGGTLDVSPLRELPNVHLTGEKSYRQLPALLRSFDVCLIPFHLHKIIEAVNPVKLYEYLSQGKPVVTSRLPEIDAPEELVYFASTNEEFALQIDAAVEERRPDLVRRRTEFAAASTWQKRAEQFQAVIQQSYPLVSVIVLTYNSRLFLPHFHRAFLENTTWPRVELIYVDNRSTDGTSEMLEELAQGDSRVKVLLLDENLGFAGGNNAAARQAQGDYLVFLNPDTVVTRGWLGRLIRPLMERADVGLTAPVTNFSGNDTRIDAGYSNAAEMAGFAAQLAVDRYGARIEVGVAPFLCVAMSRQTWERVGELDERFRVGMFEDDDYAVRVQLAGLKIVTAEDCFIHHFGNGSFSQLPSDESTAVFQRNRALFEEKWGRAWQPHRMRAGVKPLEEAPQFSVGRFFLPAKAAGSGR